MDTNNKMERLTLGIDLGGTNIRAALVKGGKVLKKHQAKLPKHTAYANDVLRVIYETINSVFIPEVEAIGVGAPGLIDMKNQAIHSLVNIPSLSYVPIGKYLYEKYNRPVAVDNDANCFTLAENTIGVGKGVQNMVGIAIGTGLGAGIISNGQLIGDMHRGAGEFGEIPYLDSKIEAYCSGQFFENEYKKSGEQLLQRAQIKSPEGTMAFKTFGKHLAQAIKIVMLTVNPEMIVIGGSVAKSKDYFHEAMMQELKDFVYPLIAEETQIKYSETPDISIIGAALLTQNI